MADKLGVCAAIQRDLESMEKQCNNFMKLNKGKWQALEMRRNNPMYQYMFKTHLLECSTAGRDHEVLVENKLTISQQCASVAKKVSLFGWDRVNFLQSSSDGTVFGFVMKTELIAHQCFSCC